MIRIQHMLIAAVRTSTPLTVLLSLPALVISFAG